MNLCMNIPKKRIPTLNRAIKVPTTSLYGLIISRLIVQGYYMKKKLSSTFTKSNIFDIHQ